MTNAQIIFNESIKLMNNGIINTTGRMIKVINATGEEKTIQEPEQIHTFAAWKELGYIVKKGEKAKAKINIWKARPYTETMQDKDGNEITSEEVKMFMKTAHFFSASQVQKMEVSA